MNQEFKGYDSHDEDSIAPFQINWGETDNETFLSADDIKPDIEKMEEEFMISNKFSGATKGSTNKTDFKLSIEK